jgi:integrase
MATITKRTTATGKAAWLVRIRKHGYPERTKTFQTKRDAEEWSRDIERAIARGHAIPDKQATQRTVADAIDRYIEHTLPHKKHNKDQRTVKSRLRWWRDELGRYALANVSPAVLVECRDKLQRGRSPATVNRHLAALSAVFRTAIEEWFWIEVSPMRNIRYLGEPRGRTRFLSDDERKALLAECRASRSPWIYPVVVVALATDMRRGEILGLTWADVDLQRQTATLRETKNGEMRVVPLTGHALDLIRELRKNKVQRIDGKVFPEDFREAFENAVQRAGIDDFRFHDLRHSAASYLAMNGATLMEIADVLGHKTLQMVKRYAHLTEQHTRSVVSRMNAQIFDA